MTRRSGRHTRNCAIPGTEVPKTASPQLVLTPSASLQANCCSRNGRFDINTLCKQNVKADGTYSYHCEEVSTLLPVCRHISTFLLQRKAVYLCQGRSRRYRKCVPQPSATLNIMRPRTSGRPTVAVKQICILLCITELRCAS